MKKSNKKSKVLSIIITILVFLIFAAWYFYGKPELHISENQISLVQTEEPLINNILAKTSLNESMAQGENEGGENPAQENVTPGTEVAQESMGPQGTQDTQVPQDTQGPLVTQGPQGPQGTHGSSPDLDQNHPENSPLYWGNPSDSISSIDMDENYLMEKPQFTISYNNKSHNPNWVAWHLSASDLGEADRADNFRPDQELPQEWYAVKKADYKFTAYGFDRGHICPSADRTSTSEDNSQTFLMTNMVPQAPDNNRVVWVALEKFERQFVENGYEAYIFAGPYGRGGSGDRGFFESIPIELEDGSQLEIEVPSHTWKIILFMPEGKDDYIKLADYWDSSSQEASKAKILAVNVPNEKGCGKNGSWQQYLCTVDYIEEITGLDFFELLDDKLEEEIESSLFSW